jgi:hypothetical protein
MNQFYLRVLSPWAPATAFPLLKLASTTVTGSLEWIMSETDRYTLMGWKIVDFGPIENYHSDPYGLIMTLIPNASHVESATTSFDGTAWRSTDFCAIVPDRKTRKEIGA